LAFLLIAGFCAPGARGSAPIGMKTEMMTDPIGLDTLSPRFSWRMEDGRAGARQTAYQVQAADSAAKLASDDDELWDSGKVASEASHLVPYLGRPLSSRQRVWWRVRTWDESGEPSAWSAAARFEAALLNPGDWKAQWITAPKFAPVDDDATALWSRMVVIPTATEAPLRSLDTATKQKVQQEWVEALRKIRPAPLFRKAFSLTGGVKSARLYSSGLGFHEVTINGRRVDDALMSPAESDYPSYAHYAVHDVTALLREGDNVIGVLLGNGRYNEDLTYFRKRYGEDLPLMVQLEVETDHGRVVVVSDPSWRCAPSPLLKDNFWVSEAWDARREMPGWDAPGFDDTGWLPARTTAAPTRSLVPDLIPPERVMRRIRPIAVTEPRAGVWVFDLGELIVGCAQLDVSVPAGTALTLRYGEQVFGPEIPGSLLHYDGFENDQRIFGMLSSKTRGNGVMALATKEYPKYHALTSADVYVARGDSGGETWHARFAFHPFRYVELTGYPGRPNAAMLTGLVVHNDIAATGSFESSDAMLNEIEQATVNTVDYAYHGCVCVDPGCEKQSSLCSPITQALAVYFRDVEPIWHKELADMRAVTQASMDPRPFGSGLRRDNTLPEDRSKGAMEVWTRHMVELPWDYRLYLGDNAVMEAHYAYMKAYVDYWTRDFVANGQLPADRDGDHMDFTTAYGKPAPLCNAAGALNSGIPEVRYLTDGRLIGAAYAIGMTRIVAEAAALSGKSDDAAGYSHLADRMTVRFNSEWFLPERNAYGRRPPTRQFTIQGGNAVALFFNLVPADKRQAVLDSLVRDIETWGGISTGVVATYPLFEVLARNGQADLALRVFTQANYPGPGHDVIFGTKTLPEVWALPGRPCDAALCQSDTTCISTWLYDVLGGIDPDPRAPGYKHFFLEPAMPAKLAFVSCRTQTPYGEIVSAWKREGEAIRWSVTVPWNSTATIRLPQFAQGKIALNGKPAEKSEFELPSGKWEIVAHQ